MSDGFLICFIARIFGKKIGRFSFDMTSLAPVVFSEFSEKRFAFVGSTKSNVEIFTEFVNDRFDITPCFISSGYFDRDSIEICKKIIDSDANVVVVGLGTPLQEEFLLELISAGYQGAAFTCGGFITQTASAGGDYYPKIFNKFNLRFLYRMIKEPHTVKRYLFQYPKGAVLFAYDLLRGKHEFIGQSH
jgi:N-acetylglucosaminyldiphosphoundecaprenol N-acetyl-beta-D-mannosaminyltransferase